MTGPNPGALTLDPARCRSSGGTHSLTLCGGEVRLFLKTGKKVGQQARATRDGVAPIGFGGCRARVLPAAAARPIAT